MIRIDLHTHSNCSDGTLSPTELVLCAKRRGISVLSLTDHDSTEGVGEFLGACTRVGVRGVAGVELSAEAPFTLHILGYHFESDPRVERTLHEIRAHRDRRNEEICVRLRRLGCVVDMEEIRAEARGEVVARPHIARVLIRKGYARDQRHAFAAYLGRGASAYVARVRLSPRECISLIRDAGGVSVLAHPGDTGLDPDSLEQTLRGLRDEGLWGLECWSPHHSAGQVFEYLCLAGKLGLYPTAGSDFHGANRPGVELGIVVETSILPWSRLGVRL